MKVLDFDSGVVKPPKGHKADGINYQGKLQRKEPTQRATIKAARTIYRGYRPKFGSKTFVGRLDYAGEPPALLLIESE